jgi:hypothetical protein
MNIILILYPGIFIPFMGSHHSNQNPIIPNSSSQPISCMYSLISLHGDAAFARKEDQNIVAPGV